MDKTGVADGRTFDVEDLATVFMRLEGGGTLLVEASWAAHRPAPDELGLTSRDRGGAELIIHDQLEPGSLRIFTDDAGVPAETPGGRLGGAHHAVVAEFVGTIRSGDWQGADGSAALSSRASSSAATAPRRRGARWRWAERCDLVS